jgi:proline iminopeptidase
MPVMPLGEGGLEQFVDVLDGALWTARQGDGPPLLLLPGGPGCADYLGPVAELLAPHFTTLRYEPRGCGRSSVRGRFDLDECVDDLEHLRRHLGVERWALLGHSWGANLALLYAMRLPRRVRALVYVSGNGIQHDPDWHAQYASARDAGLERTPDWSFEPNPEVNRRLSEAWRMYATRPGMQRAVADVGVPCLVVYGDRDIRPAWPARRIAELIPGARFELLTGADHYVWRGCAERLRALVVDHLTGC